jgi:hypothetical protein
MMSNEEKWITVGVGLAMLAVLVGLGFILYYWIFIRYEYTTIKTIKGTVTDMDYVPPRTHVSVTTNSNGTTTTSTRTDPEEHNVYIHTDLFKLHEDDEELYQTVRLDDEVTVEYQEEYKYNKNHPEDKKLNDYRVLNVVSPKGRKVQLLSPKEANYTKTGYSWR